jgi:hypothetical protein
LNQAPGGLPARILCGLYALLGAGLAVMLPLSPIMFLSVLIQGGPPGGPEEWPMVGIVGVLGLVLGAFGATSGFAAWRIWHGTGRGLGLGVGVLWLMVGMWPLGLLALWALLRERGQEIEL